MSKSALNSAVEKLEAANLTDDEINSLAEALALTIAKGDDDVQGFVQGGPARMQQGFSLNFEEIKVTVRDQLREPRNVFIVMEAENWSWGGVQ